MRTQFSPIVEFVLRMKNGFKTSDFGISKDGKYRSVPSRYRRDEHGRLIKHLKAAKKMKVSEGHEVCYRQYRFTENVPTAIYSRFCD